MEKLNWTDVKLESTSIQITYAVNQEGGTATTKRSGNVVAMYKVMLTFSGKRNGVQQTFNRGGEVQGNIFFHDAKLENMDLKW